MGLQIKIGHRREFQSKELWAMHRLRTRMFRDRMGWDVPVLSGMEIDGYDALDPHYLIIGDGDNGVAGCWRLLPTLGPNMLKDTFPQLLHGQMPPEAGDVWELSRFAIEADGPQGFGASEMTVSAMREMVVFADRMGIRHYVTVPTQGKGSGKCCSISASLLPDRPHSGRACQRRRPGRSGVCRSPHRPGGNRSSAA